MANSAQRSSGPQVRSAPLLTGGALVTAGGLLVLAGFVVGGAHLIAVLRQWIKEMDVTPSELARLKLARAKAAAAAGADAWQNRPTTADRRFS
jgi:hypothetical protein